MDYLKKPTFERLGERTYCLFIFLGSNLIIISSWIITKQSKWTVLSLTPTDMPSLNYDLCYVLSLANWAKAA